ncbi:MAG: Bifunctional NAD(P)H-hydrate repair enzyme Nnr [Chlamydiales bacterium]|nr:Bifunctional NAD(P)H-hydrate repair enzyme Nnr [Chlamydiales bacterium]
MKIVKAQEMSRIEKLAYAAGAKEEDFMLQAGEGVAELVQRVIAMRHLKPKILLLCGGGNNAGDAYVAGKILRDGGFEVDAFALVSFEKSSPLCRAQSKHFIAEGGSVTYIHAASELVFGEAEIIVDGILGTGFHGEIEGVYSAVIEKANASCLPIVSIDIPSGINGTTGEKGSVAIRACDTLFLGLPKTGCLMGEVWSDMGNVHVYDFGLDPIFVDQADPDGYLIDEARVAQLLPTIERTRHKYQAGYVVGLGGSSGMPGAPIMAGYTALRAGAGIVRLLHPEGMEAELASAPYEVIRQSYRSGDVQTILEAMERAAAVFIGPGIGTSSHAFKLLKKLLPELQKPCVIDAEALFFLASQPTALPPQTILTPHAGEMKRLLNITAGISLAELLKKSGDYAKEKKITLVLKGAPTFIFHHDHPPFICAKGDPGMATAGSGDVLTGVIAAFLAQTHDPLKAAILGVYFHAVAGEYAAEEYTSYCMTATDITESLPLVFEQFQSFESNTHPA